MKTKNKKSGKKKTCLRSINHETVLQSWVQLQVNTRKREIFYFRY